MFMFNPTPEKFSIWAYNVLVEAQENDQNKGTTSLPVIKEHVRGAADFIGVSNNAVEYIISSALRKV
jgi:hypothetical protein